MGKAIDAQELAVQCAGRWPDILQGVAPDLNKAVSAYKQGDRVRMRGVPCPVHRGKDGFKLFRDADETGGGICNTCGGKRNGFAVIEWVNGWTYRETLEAVAEYVGYTSFSQYRRPQRRQVHPPKATKPKVDPQKEKRNLYFLRKAFSERVPLDDPAATPARRYFAKRGTPLESLPWPLENVFFHPDLYFEEGVSSPAILEVVYDTQGKPVTLHRIFITDEGEKAFGGQSKRAMPYSGYRSMSGGYVPLAPIYNGLIGVAEGMETAMAVMRGTHLPCWTTINAVNLERIVLPEAVKWVIIWGDRDRKGRGQEAANNLLSRMKEEGRQSIMVFPPDLGGEKGTDWNDVLTQKGSKAFPDQDRLRSEFIRVRRMTS
jgi:phage/plasmid primase-like uncharacterized protein